MQQYGYVVQLTEIIYFLQIITQLVFMKGSLCCMSVKLQLRSDEITNELLLTVFCSSEALKSVISEKHDGELKMKDFFVFCACGVKLTLK